MIKHLKALTVKYAVLWMATLILIVAPLELVSYMVGSQLMIARGLVYSPAKISKDAYQDYLATRHEVLGWIKAKTQEDFDAIGSREIPLFRDPLTHKACVSIYGDSYTYSNRNSSRDAWSNQLSGLLDCRVSNFGVSGYGTDQAFMRFLLNKVDSAPIVILNHFVRDSSRNISQYTGARFTDDRHKFRFKPRFVLGEDANLKRIPISTLTYGEVLKMQEDPSQWLPHEYFLPNGHYGSPRFRFPYTLPLIRTLWHKKFLSLYKSEPQHGLFYQRDHPARPLQLTARILQAFADSAESQGRIPIVTIIPDLSDMQYYERNERWVFDPLIELARQQSYLLINVGQEIRNRVSPEMYSSLYQGEGHMNERGDGFLAEIIKDAIYEHGLLATKSRLTFRAASFWGQASWPR